MALEGGSAVDELLDGCSQGLEAFLEVRRPYLGYEE